MPVLFLISIHALRGEGDVLHGTFLYNTFDISIHALRGEGDVSARGWRQDRRAISIHALRGEGDNFADVIKQTVNISIHALRGEGDTDGKDRYTNKEEFQSTPSVGRATHLIKANRFNQ